MLAHVPLNPSSEKFVFQILLREFAFNVFVLVIFLDYMVNALIT